MTLTVAPNNTIYLRTTYVLIGGVAYELKQTGLTCTYSLSPTSQSVPASGGTFALTVTTLPNCPYGIAVTDSTAVTGLTNYFTSTQSINYTVAPNPSLTSRTIYATINNTTLYTGQLVITQAGQSAAVLTTSSIPAGADTASAFTVTAGSTTLQTRQIHVDSNAGTLAATTAVTGSPQFLTISTNAAQVPANYTLTVNPAGLAAGTYTNTATITAGGGSVSYPVTLFVQAPAAAGSRAAVYRAAAGLVLVDRNADGFCCSSDLVGSLGQAGDLPIAGDWTGDGARKFGLYRPSTGLFLLDKNNNGAFDSGVDAALTFAPATGDVPVVGDWTGSGVERVGVFRAGVWYRI